MSLDTRPLVWFRCRICINHEKICIGNDTYEFPRCYVCGTYMLPEKLDFMIDYMSKKAKKILKECNTHREILEALYNE